MYIMNNFFKKIQHSRHQKTLKYGIPFLIMIVGGSFGLQQFTQLRYTFSKKQPVSPEDLEKYGVIMKKPGEVTLETEFEKIQKLDIDKWENVRGPRPWE